MTTIQQADLAAERQERSAAIDAAAKAIGHPLRRVAISEMANGTASPMTIALAIEMAAGEWATGKDLRARARRRLGRVSGHMHYLEELGIIELDRMEPRRGSTKHYYRLAGTPAAALARRMLKAANTPTREDHA